MPIEPSIKHYSIETAKIVIPLVVGYFLGIARDTSREKRETANKLSKLIANEISALQRGERVGFDSFEKIFTEMDVAAIELSGKLCFISRFRFNYLWNKYKNITHQEEQFQPIGAIGYVNHLKALKILKNIKKYTYPVHKPRRETACFF